VRLALLCWAGSLTGRLGAGAYHGISMFSSVHGAFL
jgi:hypothetical protein